MVDEPSHAIRGQLGRLVGRRSGCTLTDAQLLENFVSRRDEASFEVLVWRHGAMVLSLCRRVLHDRHEAEDAFQAAFLVFARKAGSIGKRQAVGGWLYRVAYRVALRLRARAARRGAREAPAEDLPARDSADEVLWRDLRPVLDEAIDRLPEKYRVPFVLCYLQGHTNEEAAEQLGCPKGTILSRLARGRERLRSRLTRLGIALSAAGLTAALSQHAAAAAPAALVSSTVQAATAFAAGQAAAGLVSASVASLTEGVLRAMFLTKVKITAAALLALAVLGTGAGLWTHRALADRPTSDAKEAVADGRADRGGDRPAEKPADRPADLRDSRRGDVKAPDVSGAVVAVARDGKSITVEIPTRGRGDGPEAKKVEIKLSDKSDVVFHHVAANGAKPTEGYGVQVWLADGSKDLAAIVNFHGAENFRGPDLAGQVVDVAKDGKGITLEVPQLRGGRGAEGKKFTLQFNDKTVLAYSAVQKGEARLAEGLAAEVWLEDPARPEVAASVQLRGKAPGEGRRGGGADVAGKVVAVSKGGDAITLEQPPAARGEEPKKVEVKLGDKTAAVYYNVGPDGTKPAEGMTARVWLEDGSKDAAARVVLAGTVKERWALVTGKVVGVSRDGKTITLEQPSRARGEEPKRIDVQLSARTRIAYFAVGPDGAKLTEGYEAQVQMDEGSKEAVQVLLGKPADRRR
jgi:RNA polymerase sigma factor (sigma-70 family)